MPKLKKAKEKEWERNFIAPKGMHDVLPQEGDYWEFIENTAKGLARFYDFSKIETPVLEFADLYSRTTGEDTDVVRKEMYTLKTKGGDLLALRPEFTPGIARAYLEHSLGRGGQPQSLFHIGPVFRHDRPQLGRFRQFTQVGFEIIGGSNDPIYDAKVIMIFSDFLNDLGIKNVVLKINSIGCRVCRPLYKRQLLAYYKSREKELCGDCVRRLKTNPLRLLDCKREQCVELKTKAPNCLDKLCAICSGHFKGVLEYLDELEIPYVLDHRLVRGLDYYNRTVFEMFADGPGGEVGALPAGGRYDYLMELLGGSLTPAVGGACGVERLIAVMKAQSLAVKLEEQKKVFLAHAGELAKRKSLRLMRELRKGGFLVRESLAKESLKAQLRTANREGIGLVLIVGQKEIYEKTVILRDMLTGLQENISLDTIVEEAKKRMKKV